MKSMQTKICHECGSEMKHSELSRSFHIHGKEIIIKGINAYVCHECGEQVYSDEEFALIEQILFATSESPISSGEILNLEETASYLRVSNQTVYNMIRDGRIKAHKVGREWRFLMPDILAYMNSTSTGSTLAIAAKGGTSDKEDLAIIIEELEKRKNGE